MASTATRCCLRRAHEWTQWVYDIKFFVCSGQIHYRGHEFAMAPSPIDRPKSPKTLLPSGPDCGRAEVRPTKDIAPDLGPFGGVVRVLLSGSLRRRRVRSDAECPRLELPSRAAWPY